MSDVCDGLTIRETAIFALIVASNPHEDLSEEDRIQKGRAVAAALRALGATQEELQTVIRAAIELEARPHGWSPEDDEHLRRFLDGA